MKESPILMTGESVRGILEGLKTQTRRIVKPQPVDVLAPWPKSTSCICWEDFISQVPYYVLCGYCPYGAIGDRLWVKEAWAVGKCAEGLKPRELSPRTWKVDNGGLWYPALDTEPAHPISPRGKVRNLLFMPRWASRITLEITGVRVERLQDISEADAMAEGIPVGQRAVASDEGPNCLECGKIERQHIGTVRGCDGRSSLFTRSSYRGGYEFRWKQINGLKSWAESPFVWVIEFTRKD